VSGTCVPARGSDARCPGRARDWVQREFLDGTLNVAVATRAFGMGTDKPDVRSVAHAAVPDSPGKVEPLPETFGALRPCAAGGPAA